MFLQIDIRRAGIAAAASAVALMLCGFVLLGTPVAFLARIVEAVRPLLSARIAGLLSERTAELLALVGLVLAVEMCVVGWQKSSLFRLSCRRRYTALIDVLFFLSSLLSLSGALAVVLTLGLSVGASAIVNWILAHYGWSRVALPSDGVAQLAIGFGIYWLAMSFFGYWGHRLMHAAWFWPVHRFHHAATELNMITGLRQHPLEPVILSFVGLVSPMVFFNVSEKILLIFFFWGTTFDLLAHSQLPWGYGWFGRWIVAAPRVHQIHHSAADEHRDTNFATCPLWDHLFGTWYKGKNAPAEFGIPDNGYEVRPFRQFVYDAIAFYAAAARGLGGGLARSFRIADSES